MGMETLGTRGTTRHEEPSLTLHSPNPSPPSRCVPRCTTSNGEGGGAGISGRQFPGPTLEQGAQAAMADPGIRAAMASLPPRPSPQPRHRQPV